MPPIMQQPSGICCYKTAGNTKRLSYKKENRSEVRGFRPVFLKISRGDSSSILLCWTATCYKTWNLGGVPYLILLGF